MTITLFPSFDRITLTEDDKANPHKSAYENYTGIVFDTKANKFHIVTGKFRDKKDMYEKMTKQDKYLRRAYESRIWDWIQKNAETPVDGYLMLSTAVSKWINNNVLSKYYKKLLHDLPYINREGRKGDPQTMGIEASFESVENNKDIILTEDFDYDLAQQILRQAQQDNETSKHIIKVYPVVDGQPQYNKLLRTYGGEKSKYPEEGYLYNHLLNAQAPEKANDKTKRKTELNRIFNPLIYHDIRNETMYNDGIYAPYENLAFVIDGNQSQPIIASKLALNSIAGHLEKNPYQIPEKSMDTSIDAFKIANEMNIQAINEVKRLQSALEDDTLTNEEKADLESQLKAAKAKMAKTKETVSRIGKQTSAAFNFDDETRKQLDNISIQKAEINSDNSLSDEEKANKLAELNKQAEDIKTNARENLYNVNDLYSKLDAIQADDSLSKEEKDKQTEDILNRIKYIQGMYYSNQNIGNQERLIQQGHKLNKSEKPGNPIFGGDFNGEFISKIGDKNKLRKSLEKELNRSIKNNDVNTATILKNMLDKEDPRTYTAAEQKLAMQIANGLAKEIEDTKLRNKYGVYFSIPKELEDINNEIATERNIKSNQLPVAHIYNMLIRDLKNKIGSNKKLNQSDINEYLLDNKLLYKERMNKYLDFNDIAKKIATKYNVSDLPTGLDVINITGEDFDKLTKDVDKYVKLLTNIAERKAVEKSISNEYNVDLTNYIKDLDNKNFNNISDYENTLRTTANSILTKNKKESVRTFLDNVTTYKNAENRLPSLKKKLERMETLVKGRTEQVDQLRSLNKKGKLDDNEIKVFKQKSSELGELNKSLSNLSSEVSNLENNQQRALKDIFNAESVIDNKLYIKTLKNNDLYNLYLSKKDDDRAKELERQDIENSNKKKIVMNSVNDFKNLKDKYDNFFVDEKSRNNLTDILNTETELKRNIKNIENLSKTIDNEDFKKIVLNSGLDLNDFEKIEDLINSKKLINMVPEVSSDKYTKTTFEYPYSTKTEAFVNDGATSLMHYADDLARVEQMNNIVEDKTNSKLNQDLFDDKELKEDVRQALLRIANEFKDKLKLPIKPVDIYFTGSEANYNYNENSDIDVHLVYDFEEAGQMAEILSKYLQSAKRIFNDTHDITVKGLPVEVGAENKAEPLVTSGIYSLISNSWVKEPENANIEIEEPEQPYFDEIQMQIEDAISEKDKDKLEGIIKMVWDIRKEGLANEGEFGPSNTLFKHLRNSGILARLKDAYYDAESEDLSLESILEAKFTDKKDIEISEDDLKNKSEQELADGLMSKYTNSDEAISKLEDILTTCNDGYKEKVKNTIQKIKESTKFSNTCRKLVKETINKLEEYVGKNLSNMTPESYIDNMKDIAKVDEMLEFCYNEIHPNFKYKRPRLAATDENGKEIGVVLDGIEKSDDPKNVLYSKVITVRDPKTNAIYPKYERNNLMSIDDFKEIINDPKNKKWYDWVMKGQTEDWDSLIDTIEKKARNINERYRKWCYDNWERLDLLSYPPQYRVKLYNDIVHNGWPEANAIEKWKSTRKDKFTQKISIPKNLNFESLDEAKSDDWYLKSQNYDIIKKELDKYVPENILNIPFAVEPRAWKNQKKQNDKNMEPVHYYIVMGMEKGKNPTNFLVREVTYNSDDKTWTDKNNKEHAKHHDFVMNINDIIREINYSYTDASTLKLNTPEAFEQRALSMMINGPKSSNKVNRTGTQGHWIKLTKDEVLAVLQIMEEERPALYKDVTKVYLNSLGNRKGEKIVMSALKDFDPNVYSANISSVQGKPEYKLWVPKAQYDAPKKHNNNPFETLMK